MMFIMVILVTCWVYSDEIRDIKLKKQVLETDGILRKEWSYSIETSRSPREQKSQCFIIHRISSIWMITQRVQWSELNSAGRNARFFNLSIVWENAVLHKWGMMRVAEGRGCLIRRMRRDWVRIILQTWLVGWLSIGKALRRCGCIRLSDIILWGRRSCWNLLPCRHWIAVERWYVIDPSNLTWVRTETLSKMRVLVYGLRWVGRRITIHIRLGCSASNACLIWDVHARRRAPIYSVIIV